MKVHYYYYYFAGILSGGEGRSDILAGKNIGCEDWEAGVRMNTFRKESVRLVRRVGQ